MLAAIPYTTFPDLPLGLNTFGLMVALGVLLGAKVGADYAERFGVHRDDTYRTGTIMILAGIVGSRVTWVATHWEDIDDPIDIVAIWEGGIQFAGGFIAALIVGLPMMLGWDRVQRWNVLNGYAMGLTIGVAIGRIGCYAVGEHFGRETGFFLGTRYEGGDVREPLLGDVALREGMVFHNTALYEMLHLLVLFGLMAALAWRARRAGSEVSPAALVGLFMVWYGVFRFATDTLRVNDERVLSMTGAQWMALVMVPYGIYLLVKVRPDVAKLAAAGTAGTAAAPAAGLLAEEDGDDGRPVPDELEAPDEGSTGDDGDDDEHGDDEEAAAETDGGGDDDEPAADGDVVGDAEAEAEAGADQDGDAVEDAEAEAETGADDSDGADEDAKTST